jgi:hypothetical protein
VYVYVCWFVLSTLVMSVKNSKYVIYQSDRKESGRSNYVSLFCFILSY